MITKIETYRGYEISFDTDNETFLSDIGNDGTEKKSYAATKKAIDEYIKENSTFAPFDVVRSYFGSVNHYRITGIRKDGRFNCEKDGRKEQFSEYEENNTYLFDDWNEFDRTELNALLEKAFLINEQISEIRKKEAVFLSTKPTLKDIKSKYLPQ